MPPQIDHLRTEKKNEASTCSPSTCLVIKYFSESFLFLNSSLGSSQACDGHTEGRAAYIVQTYLVAELN